MVATNSGSQNLLLQVTPFCHQLFFFYCNNQSSLAIVIKLQHEAEDILQNFLTFVNYFH